MKIKTYLKIFILTFFITALAGCAVKWDDVKSQYGDLLKGNGINCTYRANSNMLDDLNTINIKANSNGVTVSLNSTTQTIIGPNNKFNGTISYNGREIRISSSEAQAFFNKYKSTGGCPTNIYINTDAQAGLISDFRTEDCVRMNYCSSYIITSSGGTGSSGGNGSTGSSTGSTGNSNNCETNSNCSKECAISCKSLTKDADPNSGKTGIELGYYKNGTKVKKYFLIKLCRILHNFFYVENSVM